MAEAPASGPVRTAGTKIAVFDYRVSPTNPIGGCHRRMLAALSFEYDFTVFAFEFDNPSPGRIAFQRIPVLRRPLALLFVTYHLVAPLCYWLHRVRLKKRFDLVQTVESNLSFGTVAYAHFCHRAYLKLRDVHIGRRNLRHWCRWLDHRLHAALEPWIYRRVKHIVVPSKGTAEELSREYPEVRGKIQVIYNPVDIESMRRPSDFDAEAFRHELGWTNDDLVLIFVALGHFERKGLPILLDAISLAAESKLKLLVVGGQPGLVRAYEARAGRLGLQDQVIFAGNRLDIRPYLWSANAFVFPSHYETFSLVAAEAAAAGLVVIAPLLHGIGEWIRDGENGLVITQTPESVAAALRRLANLNRVALEAIGARAAADVRRFAVDDYVSRWRQFYGALQRNGDGHLG